jgi:hypothetical protein
MTETRKKERQSHQSELLATQTMKKVTKRSPIGGIDDRTNEKSDRAVVNRGY